MAKTNKGALLRLQAEAVLFQIIGSCVALPMGLMFVICSTMVGVQIGEDMVFTVAPLILLGIMTALGICLIVYGVRKKRLMQQFRQYALWFSSSKSDSVQGLAAAVGKPVMAVFAQLENLLKLGFFPDAYLDRGQFRLIFPDSPYKQGPVRSMICPHCGANAAVPEEGVVHCEYCGSILSGQ